MNDDVKCNNMYLPVILDAIFLSISVVRVFNDNISIIIGI